MPWIKKNSLILFFALLTLFLLFPIIPVDADIGGIEITDRIEFPCESRDFSNDNCTALNELSAGEQVTITINYTLNGDDNINNDFCLIEDGSPANCSSLGGGVRIDTDCTDNGDIFYITGTPDWDFPGRFSCSYSSATGTITCYEPSQWSENVSYYVNWTLEACTGDRGSSSDIYSQCTKISNGINVDCDSILLGLNITNAPPTHSTPAIFPYPAYTTDNITCTNQSTSDVEGDSVTNIYNWLKDGTSITVLNIPFDTNVSDTTSGAVRDYSGYDNNGTLASGSATPTWNSSGWVGGAYEFDGNDYINITSSSNFPYGTSNRTLCAWAKTNNITNAGVILDYGIVEQDFFIGQKSDDLSGGQLGDEIYGADYWTVGVWNFVCIVYDGNNATLYGNGTYLTSGGFSWDTLEGAAYIGRDTGGSGYYWNGTIDNVMLFNRTLTAEQINQLYLDTKDGYSNSSTIVSQETLEDQNWTCEVTPNDAIGDGTTLSTSRDITLCAPPTDSDWNITSDITCENKVIYLAQDKDLNVLNGGSLALINTTLWINQTGDGNSIINVSSGGTMNITDNNGDGSLINSTNSDYEFMFRVNSGSTFSMTNSRLEECKSPGLGINTTVTEFSGNVLTNSQYGVTLYSNNNVIVNNTINSNNMYGIYSPGSNNTISNNNISHNGMDGIFLDNSNNNTISNNNISYNTFGVGLFYSENNIISNNTINSNGEGIYLSSGSNNTISNNNISYSSYSGIALSGSNNTISNNNISYNDNHGISLSYVNNTISNNTISYNNVSGILSLGGINITISNNNISFNSGTGIHSEDDVNIISTDNNISNNINYGIYSYDSDNGVFIRNTLDNNSVNIYFHTLKNSVNNTFIDSVLTNSAIYDINTSDQKAEYIILLNTTFNSSKVSLQTGSTIYVKWYLDVYVADDLGNQIENANVTAWDNSSNFAFSELTGGNGYIERQNVTEYFQNSTGKYFLTNYTIETSSVCCEADSRSLNITESTILNIVLQHFYSLYITLNINNTDNTVYIPVMGVGAKPASQLGPGANYTNHTHNYLASYNSTSLAALAAQTANRLFVSNTTTYHTIRIEQLARNSRVFLAFTKGDWQTIDNRMNLIEAGQFLAKISPSFAFGFGITYPIKLLLSYSDIDIQGNLILRKGTHKLTLDYNETTNGKPAIIFSRG